MYCWYSHNYSLTQFSIKRTRRKRLQIPFLTQILCAGWHLSPQPCSWWNVAHWAAPLWMSVRLGGALTASSTPHPSWRSGTVQGSVLSCLHQQGLGSLAELCSAVFNNKGWVPWQAQDSAVFSSKGLVPYFCPPPLSPTVIVLKHLSSTRVLAKS